MAENRLASGGASGHLRELDGIRGIACLLVLFDHVIISELPFEKFHGLSRLTPWLIGGVDLFFVLSGFLIGGILIDNKGATNFFRVFWLRRFARIMPVYYLLVFSFYLAVFLDRHFHIPWLDLFLLKNPMPLWSYTFFVQNFAQSLDGGTGGARWVASTWSLAIEEQFYLLLPFLVYFLSRQTLIRLAISCVVVAIFARGALWYLTGNDMHGYFLLPTRMDSLACGVLSAFAVRNVVVMTWLSRYRPVLDCLSIMTAVLLTGGILDLATRLLPGLLAFQLRATDFTFRAFLFSYMILRVFVVAKSTRYRRILSSPILVFFGTISYALYMYHPAINGVLYGLFYASAPTIMSMSQLLVAFLVIGLSIAVAWFSTQFFEFPIRRLVHKVRYKTEIRAIGPRTSIGSWNTDPV